MSEKIKNIATVSVGALICLFFAAVLLVCPKNTYIKNEKRSSAKAPALSLVLSDPSRFSLDAETHLCDANLLRPRLRTFYTALEYYALGKKDVNGFYIKSGSVVESVYPLKKGNVRSFAAKATQIVSTYGQGKDVYSCIIPDKAQYVDASVPNVDYNEICSIFNGALGAGIKQIEADGYLSLESYYKTDIHWRLESIDGLSSHIIREMGADVGASDGKKYSSYKRFTGSSALSSGFGAYSDELVYAESDAISQAYVYTPSHSEKKPVYNAECEDMYEFFIGKEEPVYIIKSPNASSREKLVIFRDSFARAFSVHALEYYSEIVLIDMRWVPYAALEEYGRLISDADDILFMLSTVVLNGTFVK